MALILWLLLSAAPAAAAPGAITKCLSSSEVGQQRRDEGSYLQARELFLRCAAPECPALVQSDCTRWLLELQQRVPTVIAVVRDGDADFSGRLQVLVDEKPFLDEITGRPVEIDPGQHRFRLTAGDGRVSEVSVVVASGEKDRRLVFQLPARVLVEPSPPAVVEVAPAPPLAPELRPTPIVPIVFTVGAVAAGVSFSAFGLSGTAAKNALLNDPCSVTKTCDPARSQAVFNPLLAADISLAAGVALAGLAVWRWWDWSRAPQLSLWIQADGAGAVVRTTF
jgi:hypothetical protein